MKSGIVILSIGSGDPDLLNLKTINMLKNTDPVFLRTGRHPIVAWLDQNKIPYTTLDQIYDQTEDFDQLNETIAEYLISQAYNKKIIYAVTDALYDNSVRKLFTKKQLSLNISVIPGLSTCDLALSSSLQLLNGLSVNTVSATDIINGFHYDPNLNLLVTELDNSILTGHVKVILSDVLDDEHNVYILRENAMPVSLPLWQIDRYSRIDHRSALLIPASGLFERKRFVFSDLCALMDNLRSDTGCPWDRVQTHASLRPYLIEEAWECIACIDQKDTDHLCEELGDLLFQIVFHSSIGKSFDEFSINDVITSICEKMIRRHPHVFPNNHQNDPDAWEKIKQNETGHHTVISSLDDVSSGLPALKYASKIYKKLNCTVLVRDCTSIMNDIMELIKSLHVSSEKPDSDELGLLLLLVSELCYTNGIDSELVLHQSVDHLIKRLKSAEKSILRDGKTLEHLTFSELGVYLNHVEDVIE